MLIILNKEPDLAVTRLAQLTTKHFCFKQLIELGQLVCSAGISNEFKRVPQGKDIQDWIRRNPRWISDYFQGLLTLASHNTNMSTETYNKLQQIFWHICKYCLDRNMLNPSIDTGIWRYKSSYISEYPSNIELPIYEVTDLYYDYITKFKFPEKTTDLFI